MSLGTTLKEARERKGYTTQYVAEQTRMMNQLVEELERDDFHRIVAAIYGRGFIKLYAECVEIDPAPLLAEFNETYQGFRHLGKRPGDTDRETDEPEDTKEKPKVKKLSFAHNDDGFEFADSADAAPGLPASKTIEYKSVETVVNDSDDDDAPSATAPKNNPKPETITTAPATEPKPTPETIISEPETDAASTSTTNANLPADKSDNTINSDNSPATDVKLVAETSEPVANVKKLEAPISDSEMPTNVAPEHQEQQNTDTSNDKDDDSALGELFELGSSTKKHEKKNLEQHDGEQGSHHVIDEPHAKLPVINPAPSWDDEPLDDGDTPMPWLNLVKTKAAIIVLGGLVAVAAIVFAVVAGNGKHGSVTTASQSPSNVPASSVASPVQPTQADKTVRDGTTLFTKNLMPPPDSYVK